MTSDSVRPLTPPVSKSNAKKLNFFESGHGPETDEADPVIVKPPSLSPHVVFDPTATGAYAFDLTEPQERVDPTATSEGSIIDLAKPDPAFAVPFERVRPLPGAASPSAEGWLQESLFSTNPPPVSMPDEPRVTSPEGRSLLDRLNYGNIEDLEDVRWFHRPIIWLVFGLLTVMILFMGLLMQDDVSKTAEVMGAWLGVVR